MSKIKTIYTSIVWHKITSPPNLEPDDDNEVLVYDGDLDDVVKGYKTGDDIGTSWFEASTGVGLKNPKWWAEVPFPNNRDAHHGHQEY